MNFADERGTGPLGLSLFSCIALLADVSAKQTMCRLDYLVLTRKNKVLHFLLTEVRVYQVQYIMIS